MKIISLRAFTLSVATTIVTVASTMAADVTMNLGFGAP